MMQLTFSCERHGAKTEVKGARGQLRDPAVSAFQHFGARVVYTHNVLPILIKRSRTDEPQLSSRNCYVFSK